MHGQVAANERGAALAITLIMLAALSALGALIASTARVETQISGNRMGYTRALYLAEAGISEALVRLSDSSSPYYVGEDMMAPSTGWGTYIVLEQGGSAADPDRWKLATDKLDNNLDGFVDESDDFYQEVLSVQNDSTAIERTSTRLNYPWVKVSYSLSPTNTLIRFGDSDGNPVTPACRNTSEGPPIVKVTSLGHKGRAMRRIEVELVKTPLPHTDGVIYTETDSLKFNGQSFLISGQDFDPATGDTLAGSSRKKALVTTDDPNILINNLDPGQYDQVIGVGGGADVYGTGYDLDLSAYIAEYAPYADIHYLGDTSYPNTDYWGGMDDYHVVHIENGDLHVSGNTEGGGLLLVEGNFKASGAFTWYGIVMATGNIDWAGGGQDINIYGAVMSEGTIERSDFSGKAKIVHSSKALRKLYDLKGFEILSWMEL